MGKMVTRMSNLKNIATPLTDTEKLAALMQIRVHKCINKLLMQNNEKQEGTFAKAATTAFKALLIDESIYKACLDINKKGNKVKHEAVMYLMMEFGSP